MVKYGFNPLKKESDLCEPVSDYFRNQYKDCEIFYEVKSTYSKKIDMVVKTAENDIITVELKLHANLQIINQAYNNLKYGNLSYIAIPEKSLRSFSKDLFYNICKSLNIGLLLVKNYDFAVEEKEIDLKYNGKPKKLSLFENQKIYVAAGEASGKCWSEYKETLSKIEKYLEEYDEGYLTDILVTVGHHYSNPRSGARTLKKYIETNVIKNMIITKEGKVRLRNQEIQ